MYNFIFWFFYCYFKWKKGFESISTAAAIVGLAMVLHVLFLYTLIRFLTGFSIGTIGDALGYGQRKFILLPFVLLFQYLVYLLYYKKRGVFILEMNKGKKFSDLKNTLAAGCLIVIPLIGIIVFTKLAN
ncbi:MAG: hypothetical protein J7578_12620 [Chitinophagaceae bacterium]|nr:hypothetical protein [Chitinophagaceae bacterium]